MAAGDGHGSRTEDFDLAHEESPSQLGDPRPDGERGWPLGAAAEAEPDALPPGPVAAATLAASATADAA
eukprot:6287703-Lingulodinium_polyedra.AAC.1